MTTGSWHHIVGSYDGTTVKVYLDGRLCPTTVSVSGVTLYTTGSVIIGAKRNVNVSTNVVDDVRVYNRALSATEVTALYDGFNNYVGLGSGEKGLVGWWKLDGNPKDTTPYADNGTVNGATLTTDRKGRVNGAYSFDGTISSYIDLPANSTDGDYTQKGATSLWVKVSQLPAERSMIVFHGYTYDQYSLQIELNTDGTVLASTNNGSGPGSGGAIVSPTSIVDGKWHMITLAYDGGTSSLYIDASLVGTGQPPAGWRINDYLSEYRIGAYQSEPSFTGVADELRQYKNRALSSQDISNLYNSYNSQISLGGSGQDGSISLGKGLVGYWPMNGNAKDATPYSDNGTINGATLTTDRKGRADSAYNFGGNIKVPNTTTLNLETLTVSAWIKTTQTGGTFYTGLVGKGLGYTEAYPYFLEIKQSTGQADFSTYDDSGDTHRHPYIFSTNPVNDGVWHLITATRVKGGQMALYVDGVLQSTATDTTQTSTVNTLDLAVGVGTNGSTQFSGQMDDVRIYNRALNPAEVQALYNGYD